MTSTIRDGWGILLNAAKHIEQDKAAVELLTKVRLENFEQFSREWVRGGYPVDKA